MIERFSARFCRLNEYAEILARLLLADEIEEPLGTKRGFKIILGAALRRSQTIGVFLGLGFCFGRSHRRLNCWRHCASLRPRIEDCKSGKGKVAHVAGDEGQTVYERSSGDLNVHKLTVGIMNSKLRPA